MTLSATLVVILSLVLAAGSIAAVCTILSSRSSCALLMQVRAPVSSATQSSCSTLGCDATFSVTEAIFASRLVSRSSTAFTAAEIGSTIIQDGTSVWARTMEMLDVYANARNAMEKPQDTFVSKRDFVVIMMSSG